MTDFHKLVERLYEVFPRIEAPEEFRNMCAAHMAQGYNLDQHNSSDFVEVYLAYRGVPWWQIINPEYASKIPNLEYRILESCNFLEPEVWAYYAPVFLFYYLDAMMANNMDNSIGYTEFLDFQFRERNIEDKVVFFTTEQLHYIAAIIKSAATDIKSVDNSITPETAAYWSQFE